MNMKRLSVILVLNLFVFIIAICQEDNKPKGKQAHIVFEKTVHDFGAIEYNMPAIYKFEFKNTGKEPLVLTKVKASCGCTTPSYSKEPVKKGKTGSVEVKYNTKIVGKFTKSITVYSNSEKSPIVLQIKGNVKKRPADADKTANPGARKPSPNKPFNL